MNVLVTGASGSGTTTLARHIARERGWHHIDADDCYWLPTKPRFTNKRPREERLALILAELGSHESSVVSGSVMQWGTEIEDAFDLVVFLHVGTSARVARLRRRELAQEGFVEPAFIEWASQYDTVPELSRSLAKHEAWLDNRTARILRIEGDLTTEESYRRCVRVLETLGR